MIENHGVPVEIGELSEPIPVHFAYRRESKRCSRAAESRPSIDRCATCSTRLISPPWTTRSPTARYSGCPVHRSRLLCSAPRASTIRCTSLHRLYHYTGTDPEHFQNFVIFTNYQFYVDTFARLGHEHMASGRSGSDVFVEPGNVNTRNARLGGGTSGVVPERMPQMPAFHLVEPGYQIPFRRLDEAGGSDSGFSAFSCCRSLGGASTNS